MRIHQQWGDSNCKIIHCNCMRKISKRHDKAPPTGGRSRTATIQVSFHRCRWLILCQDTKQLCPRLGVAKQCMHEHRFQQFRHNGHSICMTLARACKRGRDVLTIQSASKSRRIGSPQTPDGPQWPRKALSRAHGPCQQDVRSGGYRAGLLIIRLKID
jgi:hypothetical protein